MGIEVMAYAFYFTMAALFVFMIWCITRATQAVKNELCPPDRILTEDEEARELEKSADWEKTTQMILSAIDIGKPYQFSPAPEAPQDDYLDKFNASKVKRKQSPSSSATPMVRSKRKRK